MNKIPYDVVYTSKFGPKKQIPYVHLVDEGVDIKVIPDSNVILERLSTIFDLPTEDISPENSAISHAITRMLDEHTAQIGFYYRYVIKSADFMEKLDIGNRFFHTDTSQMGRLIAPVFSKGMQKGFGMKMKGRGLSNHSDEELWRFSNDDIMALSKLLGSKKYLFGNDQPTRADCTMFAHLSQFLFMPLDFPQKAFIERECPNLVEFVNRFRTEFWADWDDKCLRQPNQKMLDREKKSSGRRGIVTKLVLPTLVVAGFAYIFQRSLS